MVVYFDDILMYGIDVDKHVDHFLQVLIMLRGEKLYANASYFFVSRIIFLGYDMFKDGLLFMVWLVSTDILSLHYLILTNSLKSNVMFPILVLILS